MSDHLTLPRAVEPFIAFSSVLRANGFAVAPEQTQSLIAAVGLLGPRSMQDIYRAALATLAPPPERRDEFEALYRMVFLGQSVAAADGLPDEDDVRAYDERDGQSEPPDAEEINEAGGEATGVEILSVRSFRGMGEDEALRRLRRRAPAELPRRRSRRLKDSRSGRAPDMRRALREAVKRDGEVLDLPLMDRRTRQRRILLLIDISGSMKEQTDGSLRFAHALGHAAERLEVFTLGTRLTRVTRSLRHRNRDQALASVSTLVADWDGGTRLGDALEAFLAVPRFAGFARGAMVVVLSDGLERGDHAPLEAAMQRLSRLAWNIVWLTPLADDGAYVPQTEAMQAVASHVDRFGSALGVARMCAAVLDFARRAA
ncbi:MAG: VWA domain-containing protein [Brucellaceae bacterium]|nr:VWA domain-containing protein [Brucellaceae bacterium]